MNIRKLKDAFAGRLTLAAAIFSSVLVFIVAFTLYLRSEPILEVKSLGDLLLGITWMPSQSEFGFYPFILGTVYVTALAMVFAIPLSILSAVYLAEYANERLRSIILPLVDLLAGIPPVVYGLFGVLAIVPLVAGIAPLFKNSGISLLNSGSYSTGYSILAGGIVLAIMVFPIIISISYEVFKAVPFEVREASLSLGATRWQTIKHAVIRAALPGIAAAVILGFSRAIGETMAVLMVVGNVVKIPSSIFDAAYPLPALIANNYGEMMSIPLYDSALLLAALILMLIILLSTLGARLILVRIERRMHG
ncbi:Binding-protein-dependent transport system inner membrane component [uncultured archaeon]|nr:Binding-protein-dependent transport system inner membrane component [uncultured archaeon]